MRFSPKSNVQISFLWILGYDDCDAQALHQLYNLSFPTITNPAHIMPLWVNFDVCGH